MGELTKIKKILILAANPVGTAPLRLDKEVREIDNGLQRAQRREQFELRQKWAVRSLDVRRELLDFKPNFVHFCGHGEGEAGILFEGMDGEASLVNAEALAGFFKLFANHIHCILLNACYSEIQAVAISRHIDYVIGMNQAIGDEAAIEFAVAFYDALGAGESVEFGYELACNAIAMAGIPEQLKPVLIKRSSENGPTSQETQVRLEEEVELTIQKVAPIEYNCQPSTTEVINPYDPWNPTIPPHFIGRVRELRELVQALEQNRSISLVGDWRIGKSSLLKTWELQVNERGYQVVTLSGEDSSAQSLQTFVQTIIQLPDLEESCCLQWAKTTSPNMEQRAMYLIDRWIEKLDEPDRAADILAFWAEHKVKATPLLLIDEVAPCLKLFPSRFFERLRGMLGRILLVLASHRDIDSIYTDVGHTSPFGNRLSILRLGLLEPEIPNLIIQWGKNILTVEAMHTMRIWAGRHPFYLQLLGYHLVNAQQADESLEQALDNFYSDAASRLRKLWESLDEREQQVLRETLQGKPVKRRSLRIRGLVTEEDKLFGQILREWLEHEI
jgi:hypothetical protein